MYFQFVSHSSLFCFLSSMVFSGEFSIDFSSKSICISSILLSNGVSVVFFGVFSILLPDVFSTPFSDDFSAKLSGPDSFLSMTSFDCLVVFSSFLSCRGSSSISSSSSRV